MTNFRISKLLMPYENRPPGRDTKLSDYCCRKNNCAGCTKRAKQLFGYGKFMAWAIKVIHIQAVKKDVKLIYTLNYPHCPHR